MWRVCNANHMVACASNSTSAFSFSLSISLFVGFSVETFWNHIETTTLDVCLKKHCFLCWWMVAVVVVVCMAACICMWNMKNWHSNTIYSVNNENVHHGVVGIHAHLVCASCASRANAVFRVKRKSAFNLPWHIHTCHPLREMEMEMKLYILYVCLYWQCGLYFAQNEKIFHTNVTIYTIWYRIVCMTANRTQYSPLFDGRIFLFLFSKTKSIIEIFSFQMQIELAESFYCTMWM